MSNADNNPRIVSTGPSSLSQSDSLARGLGWFSLGLGLAELLAADKIADALGMKGQENLIRAYGMREIGSGVMTLSVDKHVGLMSRVGGDLLDIATLMPALSDDNPKRDNASFAMAMVLGVTMLDLIATGATTANHSRGSAQPRYYGDRTGFPNGVAQARGAAKQPVPEKPSPQKRPEVLLGGAAV
jgi:hypothetical protein